MEASGLTSLMLILALGVGAQWLAWRINIPSIAILLLAGLIAGPVLHWVEPDALFGEALMPGVSLAVGIILFEGGLTLRIDELRQIGPTVLRLCSLGALVTWALATLTLHLVLGLSSPISVLLGAVLVVTGPTVILPMLRHLRIREPAASILRWEGILIDPVGAILAVLVFEAIIESGGSNVLTAETLVGLATAAAVGTSVGLFGAWALGVSLRRYLLPDFLQNPVALAAVAAVQWGSNTLRHESGLLAVVVMGMALGARPGLPLRSILAFKENLRVLIIGILFIVLAARLDLAAARDAIAPGIALLVALIVVIRPLSVLAATFDTDVPWKSRFMLMAMAPRGIVAAAVSSIFALELAETGIADADQLISLTFFTISGTVVIYAVIAPVAARLLGMLEADAQGVLFAGAPAWARDSAKALLELGFRVQLVDTDYFRVRQARMENLPAHYGSPISERTEQNLDLRGIGKLLAVSASDDANSLAVLHYVEVFGRSEVYQLGGEAVALPKLDRDTAQHLRGRRLFREGAGYAELSRRYDEGARIRRTRLSEEFGMEKFTETHGDRAIPLFLVQDEGRRLHVFAADLVAKARPGDLVLSLVLPEKETGDATDAQAASEAKPA